MYKDYLKEKLNSLRTEMNHLWTGILITFGGTIGFITVENKTFLTYFFITLGAIFGLLFLNAYITRRIELQSNISNIKKEDR